MLASHPNLKKEYDFVYKYEQWNRMLDKAPKLSNSSPHSPNEENSNDNSADDDTADENKDNDSDADDSPNASDEVTDNTSTDSYEEAPDDLAADSKRIKLLQ
jgi:hypothetical protein